MRKLTLHKRILALFIAVFILATGMPASYALTNPETGVFDLVTGTELYQLIDNQSTNGQTAAVFAWYGYDEFGVEYFYVAVASHKSVITMTIEGTTNIAKYEYAEGTDITIGGTSYDSDVWSKFTKSMWTVLKFDYTPTGITQSYFVDTTAATGHDVGGYINIVIMEPALTITKTASPTTYSDANDIISYSYLITNTGNTKLTDLTVTDDKITAAISVGATTLLPGQSTTAAASYTILQSDIVNGSVTNVATATAYYGTPAIAITATDTETVTANALPALAIDKSAAPATYDETGDIITYTYVVTNTGNTTLYDITVVDDKIADILEPTIATLAPEASATVTATYTVTLADIDAGSVTNIAYATDGTTNSPTDTETVTANQAPALTINKSTLTPTYDSVGDIIHYDYLITNTGNTTLTGLTVWDDKLGNIPLTITSLEPGQIATGTASHTIDQDDLNGGSIYNTATATASFGTISVTDSDDETVTALQTRSMTIVKTASPATYDSTDDVITYSYLVTNTGNVTLTNVRVVDDKIDAAGEPVIPQLDPGAANAVTVFAYYDIEQDDIDAGSVTNIAYATDGTTNSASDTETVTADKKPALTLDKTASTYTYDAAGQVITYYYLITNTGNTTLYDITVVDDVLGTIDGPDVLSPDATATVSATYTVSQAELDAGTPIINTAYATDGTTDSEPDSVTVTAVQRPSLTIDKSSDISEYTVKDTVITYTVRIENTGNQTLTGVTVTDDLYTATDPSDFTESITNDNILQVGEVWTFTYTYTTTQTDVDNDRIITNTVTVDTDKTSPLSDFVTVTGKGTLSWAVTKTANKETYDKAGIVIGYTVTITNTGTKTVTGVTYGDSLANISAISKSGDTDNDGDLDYGETWTLTYTYTTTQTDVDTDRSIVNLITVSTTNNGSKTATDTVTANGTLTWTLTKTADESSYDRAGTKITYTVTIANTGTKTVTDLIISDSLVDISGVTIVRSVGSDADNDLDVGETWTLTYSYTTTMQDLYSSRNIKNIITVDPANDAAKTDDVTVTVVPMVLLTITKTVVGGGDPDQSFLFTVTGNGVNVREAIQPGADGTGSKSIRVPANGTYTVTEDTGWSWRYDLTGLVSKPVDIVTTNDGIEFINTLNEPYRLSDEAVTVNTFAETTVPSNSVGRMSLAPTAALPPEEFGLKRKTAPAVGMV